MNRYLTPREKRRELTRWRRLSEASRGRPGDPDPDMIDWCERLNAISGICTLQSCSGHGTPEKVQACGHLWLWLDESLSAQFEHRALELASAPGIERVAREYKPWGREIVVVEFAGNERCALHDSMTTIMAFCQDLGQNAIRSAA